MPRRSREWRSVGAESPERAKGLGSRRKSPPASAPTVVAPGCRLRPRRKERPSSSVHVPQSSPRGRVRMCLLSTCPGPTRGTAASPQPPGPRLQQCHPSLPPLCSRRQSPGVPRRGGEEKLRSACCPRSFTSPACATCKAGELSHTIYRRLDLPVTSVSVLSMKYFDWHPSRGERGQMCHAKVRNEVTPHEGTE